MTQAVYFFQRPWIKKSSRSKKFPCSWLGGGGVGGGLEGGSDRDLEGGWDCANWDISESRVLPQTLFDPKSINASLFIFYLGGDRQ